METHNDINNLDAFNYKVEPGKMLVPDPMNPGEYCNDKYFKVNVNKYINNNNVNVNNVNVKH